MRLMDIMKENSSMRDVILREVCLLGMHLREGMGVTRPGAWTQDPLRAGMADGATYYHKRVIHCILPYFTFISFHFIF